MSDTELKPCPFCGEAAPLLIPRTCNQDTPYDPADYAYPRIQCACGAEMAGANWSDERTAIAAWNRRALAAATPRTME